MTKEEIIGRCINEQSEKGQSALYSADWAKIAMDEYAKQEAIGFAGWLNNNYYMDDGGFYHHDYQNKTRFTLEELYNLYHQSKNK